MKLLIPCLAGLVLVSVTDFASGQCSVGPSWKLRSTTGPSPRSDHAMAYDSFRGVVLLYGGDCHCVPGTSLNDYFEDTWEWNGDEWTLRTALSRPGRRMSHAMAFDSVRNRVVMFGGFGVDELSRRNDTWEWNGTRWRERFPFPYELPPAVNYQALVYDSGRNRTVLFGGVLTRTRASDQTWEWDGECWLFRTDNGPSARAFHGMAYDSDRHVTVLFGGRSSIYNSETWEWSGGSWAQEATTGPAERHTTMAYYGAEHKVLLFGGLFSSTRFDDTWLWDGTNWTLRPTDPSPAARTGHDMVYDSRRKVIVMFGGERHGSDGGLSGETWEYGCPEGISDCNGNCIDDGCEMDPNDPDGDGKVSPDCNGNQILDECDLASGLSADCNANGVLDECDIEAGTSADCQGNGVPDECETDCNDNGLDDACDIASGTSLDCQENGIPDECEPDCNENSVADECDIRDGGSSDCQPNGVPDECDISGGVDADCQGNGIPDACELDDGAADCDDNGVPDECDQECGVNGIPDVCEADCNLNGLADDCDILFGFSDDCNENTMPDSCDIVDGRSADCQPNGVPDECDTRDRETDCNYNDIPDVCDIDDATSEDCQLNGVPDECEVGFVFSSMSGNLSPIDSDHPQSHRFPRPPPAHGDVALTVAASADLSRTSEYLDISINGFPVGRVFGSGGEDCSVPPNIDMLVVSPLTFNSVVDGVDAIIGILPSVGLDVGICSETFVSVSISYDAIPMNADCNDNHCPDECESLAGRDYNNDGVIDLLDFGFFADCVNGPAVGPSPADPACAEFCLSGFDSDQDGDADLADIAGFLVTFGTNAR